MEKQPTAKTINKELYPTPSIVEREVYLIRKEMKQAREKEEARQAVYKSLGEIEDSGKI